MIQAYDAVALAMTRRATRKHFFRNIGMLDVEGRVDVSVEEQMVLGLQSAELFDVENVKQWLMAMRLTGADGFDMVANLPCCTPPFPYTYFEWEDQSVRASAFVITETHPDRVVPTPVFVAVFDHVPHHETFLLGTVLFHLDASGQIISKKMLNGELMPDVEITYEETIGAAGKTDEKLQDLINFAMAKAAAMTLFACSLMHCRNVKQATHDPRDEMNRQQIRLAERQKRRLVIYRTLEVSPVGRRSVKETDEGVIDGPKKRLHLVRLHYAEYGPEYRWPDGTPKGLLFGKYSGRFFVPPFVKGSLNAGAVAKTYRIGAPRVGDPVPIKRGSTYR